MEGGEFPSTIEKGAEIIVSKKRDKGREEPDYKISLSNNQPVFMDHFTFYSILDREPAPGSKYIWNGDWNEKYVHYAGNAV